MAYSTEIAKVLAAQLTRFATLNRHQLVGQAANLDFWLDEVRHFLQVIDGYGPRFERLKTAQNKYTKEHQTFNFDLDDPCCIQWSADRPKRVSHTELTDSRRLLCDATYRFLIRLFNEAVINMPTLRHSCESLGIGIERSDLKRQT